MTYGEIAKRLGVPHESREVGQALGRNPIAIIVPCHRVLGADGKMGGFSANGGVATKRRILEIEGAPAVGAGPLFAASTAMAGFGFDPAEGRRPSAAGRSGAGARSSTRSARSRMQLKSSRSLFGALAEAIVYQQLSNKAAATIYGRVEALFPRAKRRLHAAPHPATRRRAAARRAACRAPRCWRCSDLARRVARRRVADARRGAARSTTPS